MKVLLPTSFLSILLASASVTSGTCHPPPVTSEEQAVCLATHYFQREWPAIDWKALHPTATEEDESWLVQFIDTRPGARGGGGELMLDAQTGKVTRVLGYR